MVDKVTEERFPIKNGIPVLLIEEVKGLNKLYQKRYDWFVHFYGFMISTIGLHIGGKEAFKRIAEIIEVKENDRVLETSIGTGLEIENLYDYGKKADYYGLDISHGMLKQCLRNSIKGILILALYREMLKLYLLRTKYLIWFFILETSTFLITRLKQSKK